MTFVQLRLFYYTRYLSIFARAALLENLRFQFSPTTRHLYAVVCLRVHRRIGAVSVLLYTTHSTHLVVESSPLCSSDWEALSTAGSESEKRQVRSYISDISYTVITPCSRVLF